MLHLVDSSGWIEFFGGGAAAPAFADVLEDTESLLVPTIVVYEVMKWLRQRWGEEDLLSAYAALLEGTVIDLDPTLALEAAGVSCRHRLPMADSIILATARTHGATIWTKDRHFSGLDGVRYFPDEA